MSFVDFDSLEDEEVPTMGLVSDTIDTTNAKSNNAKLIHDSTNKLNKRNDYYKVVRRAGLDPIMDISLEKEKSFKFSDKWDPYTGERSGTDPDGALYFHPDILIKYFYEHRLNGLWVEPVDEKDGFYEGYYDISVGAGHDIYIESRGYYPEKYLFRLPIVDCYLTDDHKDSVITMGPLLTDTEIEEIEKLSNNQNYKSWFGKNKPSLINMKKYYDMALNNRIERKDNIEAVDQLRQL